MRFYVFLILSSPLVIGYTSASGAAPPAPDPATRISQYVDDAWQIEDGLPANDVLAIVHARDGFLWLATRGGLVRFDGVRFEVFNMVNTPIFRSDDFGALIEGPDGSLWAGSRGGGLYRYRQRVFVAYPTAGALASDVRSLLIDRTGNLWVGSLGGLLQVRGDRLEAVQVPPPLAGADVRALHEDADGLWIGTNGRGLFRHREGSFEALSADGLSSDVINAVLRDRAGSLWIGTADGLNRLVDRRVTVYRQEQGLLDVDVRALHEDAAGSLWIATGSGFYRFRDGRFESSATVAGIAHGMVRTIHVDREGSLWAGTYSNGLHRFKVGPVIAYSESEGLSHNQIWTVYELRSGDLLIGSGDGGIDRLQGGALSPLAAAAGFPSAPVYSLLEDRHGVLWIGTSAGLVRSAGGDLRVYTEDDGLPDDNVRIVYQDPHDSEVLWLGTFAGIVSLRGGVVSRYDTVPGLPGSNTRAILRDHAGALWIGTESGLVRWHEETVTELTTADGLSSNAIRTLYEDAEGTLWIGTRGGGIARRQGGEISAYTTRHGLPHNDVWAILEDGDGNLWWSSDQGLTRARKADFDAYDQGRIAAIPARAYGLADGMRIVECNGVGYPSGWAAADGMLYFASMGVVVRVDPRPRQASAPSPVYVETLRAGGASIELNGSVGPRRPIELPPDRRNLEIGYTAPQLRDAGEMRFRYRLNPNDPDWIDAGTRRTAYYTNLSPGSYEFRVSAGSEEAGWGDSGATLAFTLKPYFYQTRWFQALCVLALGLAVGQAFRWRTRSILTRNLRLQAEIDQRRQAEAELEVKNAELEAKNTDLERFTYTVSHDLKAPLVTIRGFLGLVQRDAAAGNLERLDRDLTRIDAAALKMAHLLEDLLKLARVGLLSNPPEEVALGELAHDARERLAGQIQERGVEVDIASDLPTVRGDPPRLLEVFQNLLENAVKYMADQQAPRIEVGVLPTAGARDGRAPVIYVRDNGQGIDPRHQEKVFGLFERLDPEATEGRGIGLALVKRIVEAHGGRIWVESEGMGLGSTFYVTLKM